MKKRAANTARRKQRGPVAEGGCYRWALSRRIMVCSLVRVRRDSHGFRVAQSVARDTLVAPGKAATCRKRLRSSLMATC